MWPRLLQTSIETSRWHFIFRDPQIKKRKFPLELFGWRRERFPRDSKRAKFSFSLIDCDWRRWRVRRETCAFSAFLFLSLFSFLTMRRRNSETHRNRAFLCVSHSTETKTTIRTYRVVHKIKKRSPTFLWRRCDGCEHQKIIISHGKLLIIYSHTHSLFNIVPKT